MWMQIDYGRARLQLSLSLPRGALIFLVVLLIAGCSPSQEATIGQAGVAPSIIAPGTLTTLSSEPTMTATFTPSVGEELPITDTDGLESNRTLTVTGMVAFVVPADNFVFLYEMPEGIGVIALQPESQLVDVSGETLTLAGVQPGTMIQATGYEEGGQLITERMLVVATPSPTMPTLTPQPSPAPATPISLANVSPEWIVYDFPDLGTTLSMPSDWEMLRWPDGYFFSPTTKSVDRQLAILLKGNVPVELPAMTEALTEEYAYLTSPIPIWVSGFEGIAFWNISPYTCTVIYVPAHGVVHHLAFFSTFCNETGDQLNEVGQKILDSIQFYPARP